jgi:hypothetical protein
MGSGDTIWGRKAVIWPVLMYWEADTHMNMVQGQDGLLDGITPRALHQVQSP